MAKYRTLFLEEAADHLGEISRALLELEKDAAAVPAIDTIFRMAHSIKSMAASLGYESISEVAHALEDRMEGIRTAGCVEGSTGLRILFRGLEGLESMVDTVRETGDAPPPVPDLVAELAGTSESAAPVDSAPPAPQPAELEPKKKVLT